MIVEVVAVGTELLLGQIVNSNAAHIGSRLAEAGLDHFRQVVVGDNEERIAEALRLAIGRSDAVIVTGGIGPTQDDLTREALARAAGVPLELSEAAEARLRSWWEGRGRPMPESNLRQAYAPAGADLIPNGKGTAPGLALGVDGVTVYVLPGVPQEMAAMLEESVLPRLTEARSGPGRVIASRLLRTWGESESRIAELIGDLYESSTNPTLAFLASGGEIKLRLTAAAGSEDEASELIDPFEAEIRRRLGDLVFSVGERGVEAVLLEECADRGWSMGTAESMTGGLVASRITSVPGASRTFVGSIVSYRGAIKVGVLGVSDDAMAAGVVTEAVAIEMAAGARTALGTDVALAVTGSAGPEPLERPVGTVVIAVETPEGARARTLRLPGDRERIRVYAATAALHHGRLAVTGSWW